jgi:uncharacterized protein
MSGTEDERHRVSRRSIVPDDPFVVHVARLRRAPGARRHEVRRGPADSAAGRAGLTDRKFAVDSSVPEGAEAACDVVLESFDGGVMVTGTVLAPWQGVCRRCTAPVGGELRARVRERFTEPGGRYGDPDDEEAYRITADQLDLWPMVRDALVLDLPLAPLCRPDCRGLCPHCGTDLNVAQCACVPPTDPRWANLDVLRSAR